MAGPIFDSHAHYLSRQFDGDREALLRSLPAAGVAVSYTHLTLPTTSLV